MPGSKRKYIFIGLVAIIVIYTLYYMEFVYVRNYNQIPRKVRHIARFLSILLVYGAGLYAFKKYNVKWMKALWNFIYLIIVVLLILIGIYDWNWGPASDQIRNVARTMHEFLISPILFGALIIINRMLVRSA